MKVWITKYALTQGIIEAECYDIFTAEDPADNMICIRDEGHGIFNKYYRGEGREWHRTKESAVKKANEMRLMEIVRLKMKAEQLENMKFE